jgi:hypothetical protein
VQSCWPDCCTFHTGNARVGFLWVAKDIRNAVEVVQWRMSLGIMLKNDIKLYKLWALFVTGRALAQDGSGG